MVCDGDEKLSDLMFFKIHKHSAGQKEQPVPHNNFFKPCCFQKERGNTLMSFAVLVKIFPESDDIGQVKFVKKNFPVINMAEGGVQAAADIDNGSFRMFFNKGTDHFV